MDEFGNGLLAWTGGGVHVLDYSRQPPQLTDVTLSGRRVRFAVDEPATVSVGDVSVAAGAGNGSLRLPKRPKGKVRVVAQDAGPGRSVVRIRP